MNKYFAVLLILLCCSACATKPYKITGSAYDASQKCWRANQVMGTTTAEMCQDILIKSKDENGVYWRHNSCYPSAHTKINTLPKEIENAPSCPSK